MKVGVDIWEDDVDGDTGIQPGLKMVCKRCRHPVEVYGTGSGSARYGAVLFGQECPKGESNYYDVDWWT